MITPEETALVHSAITWSAGLGEPVAKEDLDRSPLMIAWWIADPVRASRIYTGARNGELSARKIKEELVRFLEQENIITARRRRVILGALELRPRGEP